MNPIHILGLRFSLRNGYQNKQEREWMLARARVNLNESRTPIQVKMLVKARSGWNAWMDATSCSFLNLTFKTRHFERNHYWVTRNVQWTS
jgi:hypothetical protein